MNYFGVSLPGGKNTYTPVVEGKTLQQIIADDDFFKKEKKANEISFNIAWLASFSLLEGQLDLTPNLNDKGKLEDIKVFKVLVIEWKDNELFGYKIHCSLNYKTVEQTKKEPLAILGYHLEEGKDRLKTEFDLQLPDGDNNFEYWDTMTPPEYVGFSLPIVQKLYGENEAIILSGCNSINGRSVMDMTEQGRAALKMEAFPYNNGDEKRVIAAAGLPCPPSWGTKG